MTGLELGDCIFACGREGGVQWLLQMAHLVIFDDRLPPEYQLTVIDVPRDNERIEWIETCVEIFLKKLDENVGRAKGERL